MTHRRRKWHEFEQRHEPLASLPVLRQRMLHSAAVAGTLIGGSLLIGVLGYRWLGGLPRWVDCLYNASMILGGMGPVDTLSNNAAKIFAGLYALFSGVFFLVVAGVVLAPFLHRVLHRLHVTVDDGSDQETQPPKAEG